MNLTDKLPAELNFNQMIKEVKNFLEKYENKFLDGNIKIRLGPILFINRTKNSTL